MSAPQEIEKDARVMLEDAIAAEVGACTMERRSNSCSSGGIRSHPSALETCDSTWCIPDFVPVCNVAWPEPLLLLWKTMNYSSLVGFFHTISRVWLAVDNRLILWDYRNGREFCQYDEISELITAVGEPVPPHSGIFQPHVTFVLPVATCEAVYLLGVCVINEEAMAEIKVVNLAYAASASFLTTKIVCTTESGRIFCAGADGNLYELRYNRESTLFVPKIQLLCFSFLFSSVPVMGQVMSLFNTLKHTWTGLKAGLRDIAVDERRDLLFSLDEKNVINAWRILPNKLGFLKSLSHQPNCLLSFNASHSQALSPLVKLFVVEPDQEGCTLVAISLSGEQFHYRYAGRNVGDYNIDFSIRGYVPSYCDASREVGVCYARNSVVLLSASVGDSGDELVAITTPKVVMEPHSSFCNVITAFDPAFSRVVRADAIDAVFPTLPRKSPNELCAQVSYPPSLYVVVHRHGLSFFLHMRPVDTLYTIMRASEPRVRDMLLQRFAAVYNVVDYATMLLQVAIGGLDVSGARGGPLAMAGLTNLSPAVSTTLSSGGVTLQQLGSVLLDGSFPETRRLARELLRSTALPTTQNEPSTVSGMKQITLVMSPFSKAIVTYMARALYSVWDVPLHKLPQEDFKSVENALSLLVRFLESTEVATYNEESLRVNNTHQWKANKVVVTLPLGANLPLHDVNKLQMIMMLHAYQIARKALQTALLFHQSRFLPLQSEDRLVTFAQVVRDDAVARRLGQYYSQLILCSQKGIGAASSQRVRSFNQLQKSCPYFFSNVDTQEFQARSEIAALTHGGALGSFSETQLTQWMATVSPHAASYWVSGALQTICQQLNHLKREDLAVQLLLHAANQMDPSNSVLPLYLAEQGGRSAQESTSTTLYTLYQSKCHVLQLVISSLEAAWLSHRSALDLLLGGPHLSGTIWQIEPNDELAHYYLFDWLRAPRDDLALAKTLRDTLVAARSPFLEKYLAKNSAFLGEEYAHYLRRTKRDYKAAIEQSVMIAQSPLTQIPSADRLAHRIRCLGEALECARECGSDQTQQVQQLLGLLEAQQRLLKIVSTYIAAGQPQLDKRWRVDGRVVTERDLALSHVELLSNYISTASEILQIAAMYSLYGGAEVQLDVLMCSNVSDSAMYAMCIARAYQLRDGDVETITRRLIERYYKQTVSFPLTAVIPPLEAHYYAKSPQGSRDAVKLLLECGVDIKVIFYAYQDLIEERNEDPATYEVFAAAGLTVGYLIHALAFALFQMTSAARRGTIPLVIVHQALRVVQNYISLCATSEALSAVERQALSEAETLLRLSDNSLHGF